MKNSSSSDAAVGLSIRNLTAGYGALKICQGIDLEIPAGSIVALLGSNGAGKSTFMRALSGLLPSQGSILLGDRQLSGRSVHQRARAGLVTVSDDRALFPELTVRENLRLGASLGGVRDPMPELVRRFPALAERGGTKVGLLSGGEQQMVALTKALVARPKVLLLDEPSQGLAPSVIKTLSEALMSLRDENLAVLIAEQNVDMVDRVADSFAVLSDGRVVGRNVMEKLDRGHLAQQFLG
ncbi:ABC transporter ATP-binding protein [Nocardioides sp.]|uniref:ABC transporter ATP-binding protein n=1 Tax=Nocardioides sp. TaxID=35761 RepID=UPI002616824A|nr:ABC transporter ATP-binding protein [Nocardioides sp.]MDI6912319.1 ABC transporter ATP-binding protein [Nocardioides sp.]